MSSWLRNKDKSEAAPANALATGVEAFLPSSVRQPDANRFAPDVSGGADDGDDEDLDFLAGLVADVDRAATPIANARSAPLRGASPRIDDLQVFREMKDEGDQKVQFDHQLSDLDMDDLLEELTTVRAALRRRKAA